jgi:hypothetical protein
VIRVAGHHHDRVFEPDEVTGGITADVHPVAKTTDHRQIVMSRHKP